MSLISGLDMRVFKGPYWIRIAVAAMLVAAVTLAFFVRLDFSEKPDRIPPSGSIESASRSAPTETPAPLPTLSPRPPNHDEAPIERAPRATAPAKPRAHVKPPHPTVESSPFDEPKEAAETKGRESSLLAENFAVLDRATRGSAGISAPRSAVVSIPFRVILQVDTKQLDTIFRSLAAKSPENEARAGESNIILTPRMSAVLSGSGFTITPEFINPTQAINASGPTTWSWQVEATKPGTLYLAVTLSQILMVEGKEVGRYNEFNKTVQVAAKPFSFHDFVREYWQWLGTIVIIPLAKAIWDRWAKSRRRRPDPSLPSLVGKARERMRSRRGK